MLPFTLEQFNGISVSTREIARGRNASSATLLAAKR